jgi:hypothetical protein
LISKFISNKNYGKQLNIREVLEDPVHHVDLQILEVLQDLEDLELLHQDLLLVLEDPFLLVYPWDRVVLEHK